jgi:hypothetical protein
LLQIQLGQDREVDPSTDALGRDRIGYRPGMTEQEAWTAGRGVWVLKVDRALTQDEVKVVNLDGIVLAVADVLGVAKTREPGRYAIDGKLKLGDPRVGKPTTTPHKSRNSVGYF